MTCPSKITLISVNKEKDTLAKFLINWETYKLENVKIFLTNDGKGITHELVELTLIEVAINVEKKITDYYWDFCKNLFHVVADWSLERTPHWKHN